MGLGPPKVMKSTWCSATTLPWKHRPPLCHLDRSAAKWRDLCVDALSWECFSTAERSGGTCGFLFGYSQPLSGLPQYRVP